MNNVLSKIIVLSLQKPLLQPHYISPENGIDFFSGNEIYNKKTRLYNLFSDKSRKPRGGNMKCYGVSAKLPQI